MLEKLLWDYDSENLPTGHIRWAILEAAFHKSAFFYFWSLYAGFFPHGGGKVVIKLIVKTINLRFIFYIALFLSM